MADKPATASEEGFNFGAYMKERAMLVNEALDRSVPLQYPEVIHESMRCGAPPHLPSACTCKGITMLVLGLCAYSGSMLRLAGVAPGISERQDALQVLHTQLLHCSLHAIAWGRGQAQAWGSVEGWWWHMRVLSAGKRDADAHML